MAVSVSNTLSEDFVMVNIETTFMPKTNEVWIKNAANLEEKFWLIQPMQVGVNYTIKHSGEFLYKLTNEDDGTNYSIKRIALPNRLKKLEMLEAEDLPRKSGETTKDLQKNPETGVGQWRIPGRQELPPVTKYLTDRS